MIAAPVRGFLAIVMYIVRCCVMFSGALVAAPPRRRQLSVLRDAEFVIFAPMLAIGVCVGATVSVQTYNASLCDRISTNIAIHLSWTLLVI